MISTAAKFPLHSSDVPFNNTCLHTLMTFTGIHPTCVIFYISVAGKLSCLGPDELLEDRQLQWLMICKQKFIHVCLLIVICVDFAKLPSLLTVIEITLNPEESVENVGYALQCSVSC